MLTLEFDCNAFLSVLATCLNQEKGLNWPGRLNSVLTFLDFFSKWHKGLQQLFHVKCIRFWFSICMGIELGQQLGQ